MQNEQQQQQTTILTPSADAELKPWVAPAFERTPLNEALGGSTVSSSDVAFNLS